MISLRFFLQCFNTLILSLAVIIPIHNSIAISGSHRQMQGTMSPHTPNSVFILDFDGTITTKDTISPMFEWVVDFHAANGRGTEMYEALLDIQREYAKDLADHRSSEQGLEGLRTVGEVVQYQRGLKAVETRSFERVSKYGIFGGIDSNMFGQFGRKAVANGGKNQVVIRKGLEQFVKRVQEAGGGWGIVSVNFSEDWIRGVLGTFGFDVKVFANQPDEMGHLKGPKGGELIVTSDEKVAAMKTMLKGFQMEGASTVVYVGDSGTDIECLLAEGVVGITMVEENGSSKLLDTLRRISSDPRFGFLKNIRGIKNYDEQRGKALYFARDFREIVESPLFK